MKKFVIRIMVCLLIAAGYFFIGVITDRITLNTSLIRFHVVANSDSREDQMIKHAVRDTVLNSIESDLEQIADMREAKSYLQQNLPKIQILVDQTLEELAYHGGSHVSLCKEAFDVRYYDTFTLPAGVYESLRIVIGEGLGQNWWCVTFPSLCIPATTSGFEDMAVGAGFRKQLVETISGNEDYSLQFYLLNQLGKLENILFRE